MKGSIIVTFDELTDSLGGSYFDTYVWTKIPPVQSRLRDKHYTDITNLYSTYLDENDRFSFAFGFGTTGAGTKQFTFNLTRRSYTTDDTDGNMGIVDELITGFTTTTTSNLISVPFSGPFTATTRPDSYDFEYRVNFSVVSVGPTPTPTPTPTVTPTPTPSPTPWHKKQNIIVFPHRVAPEKRLDLFQP